MEGGGKEEYELSHKQENTSMFALQNQKSKNTQTDQLILEDR